VITRRFRTRTGARRVDLQALDKPQLIDRMALRERSRNLVLGGHTRPAENEPADPPRKRLKSEPLSDSDSVEEVWTTEVDAPERATDVESCLAPVRTDQESIDEYESSQAAQDISGSSRSDQGGWIRGRSSIYVDAFNLALETVLDEESHLFNEAERALFGFWKQLSYEAQYL
jgi:fanconi-associated nuclease 1